MSVIYMHLTYEKFKDLEKQMKEFKETTHKTEGGFYHKSLSVVVDDSLIVEFHGPLVGGYGHIPEQPPVDYPILGTPERRTGGLAARWDWELIND